MEINASQMPGDCPGGGGMGGFGIDWYISALGLRTLSHALRTMNVHCVLYFGAFTFSE